MRMQPIEEFTDAEAQAMFDELWGKPAPLILRYPLTEAQLMAEREATARRTSIRRNVSRVLMMPVEGMSEPRDRPPFHDVRADAIVREHSCRKCDINFPYAG